MVRQATMEDLPQMLAIFQIAREFMQANGNPNQWKDNRPDVDSIVADIMRGDSYLIEREGRIVGTFVLMKTPDPCYNVIVGKWQNDEKYGTIHKVASDGTCKGILQEAIMYCESYFSNLRIDTHADNRPMRHLVEKNGFVYCGIVFMEDGSERLAFQRVRNPNA